MRLALALVAALVTGASAGLFFFMHDGSARTSVADPPGVSTTRVSTTGPAPSRPLRARSTKPAKRLARPGPSTISIPRLHLRSRVYSLAKLNRGPAWWRVTGRPGGGDTVAIAGHRITHTHPFYYLERLRPGDPIYVTYRGHVYRYRVLGHRVLPSSDLHIADAVGYERLLLTACTPRGSAAYRLVVEARPA